jgi:TolA-binding protein
MQFDKCVLVSVFALSAACWVPQETGDVMLRSIRKLEDDLSQAHQKIEKQAAHLKDQTDKAQEKIEEVDGKLHELNRAARQTDAGMGVRMDELQRELQELRGQNELYAHQIGQFETKLVQLAEFNSRMDSLENSLPTNQSQVVTEDKKPQGGSKGKLPGDAKGLLVHGKKLLTKKSFPEARGVLRQVIQKAKRKKGLTDDAYFHIGESYFREKKYRSALQEYIQVAENFPKSPYADDSYYRIGLCARQLGNLEDAIIFFNEIINNHRRSPLVKSAKQQIQKAKKQLGKENKGRK